MKLYLDKARQAMGKLAEQLGWDVTKTAAGIYDIANAHMADLVRNVTIEGGYDPRDFVLFAYGGNGPMHAAVYAAELGVSEVVIPAVVSTYSALGLALSDILHSHRMFQFNPMPMDPGRLNENFETLERMANEELITDGVPERDRAFNYAIDMRWGAQYYTVRMPVERKKYGPKDVEALCTQFDELYESLYGKGSAFTQAGRFATAFMVDGIGKISKPPLLKHEPGTADASKALKGKRDAFFRAFDGYRTTNIYDYAKLKVGNVIPGPGIIETTQTTIVVPPGRTARVDAYFNVIIK
jgi:N-methylhydantoinase A